MNTRIRTTLITLALPLAFAAGVFWGSGSGRAERPVLLHPVQHQPQSPHRVGVDVDPPDRLEALGQRLLEEERWEYLFVQIQWFAQRMPAGEPYLAPFEERDRWDRFVRSRGLSGLELLDAKTRLDPEPALAALRDEARGIEHLRAAEAALEKTKAIRLDLLRALWDGPLGHSRREGGANNTRLDQLFPLLDPPDRG